MKTHTNITLPLLDVFTKYSLRGYSAVEIARLTGVGRCTVQKYLKVIRDEIMNEKPIKYTVDRKLLIEYCNIHNLPAPIFVENDQSNMAKQPQFPNCVQPDDDGQLIAVLTRIAVAIETLNKTWSGEEWNER